MSFRRWIVAVAAALLTGLGAGYWWAHRSMAPDEASAELGAAGRGTQESGKGKVLYWHDPMVPSTKFNKPGKSPFMNMQLVPVYEDEGGASGAVKVSGNTTQNLGIRLGRVEKNALTERLEAVGTIAFDEHLTELVQARVTGYVAHLSVRAPLDRVRRGQSLATIDSPEWIAAQEEYLALLEGQSEYSASVRQAARQRLGLLGVPDSAIRSLETDRTVSKSTPIYAPIDGVVTELGIREGAAFMPGATLFRIQGLRTVWVNAQIPETQVHRIPMGARVEVRSKSWPGTTFTGRVTALLPEIEPSTRTLTARVVVDNPKGQLSPGMFASLTLVSPPGPEQLAVPSEAVITTGERTVVILARDDGSFDVANVTPGSEIGDQTPILSGLQEGQQIVLSGQFLIDSEASLKSAVTRLSAVAQEAAPTPDDSASQRALHLAQGTIKAIGKDEITITHGPVPSLQWGAMTMGFKVPSNGLPADLKVGDVVSFSFAAGKGGQFGLDALTVLDASASAATSSEPHP